MIGWMAYSVGRFGKKLLIRSSSHFISSIELESMPFMSNFLGGNYSSLNLLAMFWTKTSLSMKDSY